MKWQDLDETRKKQLDAMIPPNDDGPLPGAMRRLFIAGHADGPPDEQGRYPAIIAAGASHAWLAIRHHQFACGDAVVMGRCSCGTVGWSLFSGQGGCGPQGHRPLRDSGLEDSDQFDPWHKAFLTTLDLKKYQIGRIWTSVLGTPLGN